MLLEKIAERAANKMNRKIVGGEEVQEVMFDPASIALMITILTTVVKLINRCKEEKERNAKGEGVAVAVNVARMPTGREKRILRRIMRRRMGWWGYWRRGEKAYDAIRQTGEEITNDEMRQLLIEA